MRHAVEAALRLKLQTVQVFVKNQRQWRAAPLDDEDVAAWKRGLATPGFGPPVAHATYLINLATPNAALRSQSVDALAVELRRCDTLAIPYLVLHPGSAGDGPRDEALRRAAAALSEVLAQRDDGVAQVLLETTAGQGGTLGRTFAELGELIARTGRGDRLGVCVDTCHVFAAGYDIRDPCAYEAMIDEASRCLGLERIRCWHINDSVGALGSRVDRHAHIGHGCIGASGFRSVLRDPRFAGLPMILETPKGENDNGRDWDLVNAAALRRIAAASPRAPTPVTSARTPSRPKRVKTPDRRAGK